MGGHNLYDLHFSKKASLLCQIYLLLNIQQIITMK